MKTMKGQLKEKILPLKKRVEVQNKWLRNRLFVLLPELMRESGIDMWLIMTDEQNEDPITKTLLPASMINARSKMMLLFTLDDAGNVMAETISKPCGIEDLYQNRWYGISDTDWKGKKMIPPQNTALEYFAARVKEVKPNKIGIQMDASFPYCDGLSASNYRALCDALGEDAKRLTSATDLSIRWMETRTEEELQAYDGIVQLAHSIIDEVFSPAYVTPGVTTVDELAAVFSQKIIDLGIKESFESSCAVFRKGDPGMHNEGYTILPGDILHCDIGIDYLGLCTDTQQLAYILKPGETEAPEGLKHALRVGNRLQDIVISKFERDKTGNQILAEAREEAIKQGLEPCIYSHPLGVFAHAPGPSIGSFGNQGPSEHGMLKVHTNTAYSLELNVTVPVPEWHNQPLMTCIETDIFFDGSKVFYFAERQTELILMR